MRIIALGLVLLLIGCAGSPVKESAKPISNPSGLVSRAAALQEKGDWSKAIDTLDQARKRFPQNGEIAVALQRLQAAYDYERRSLEDQLLVLESRMLLQKQVLLERLQQMTPDDYLLRSRVLFWQQFLQTKYSDLRGCARNHRPRNLWLARRCLQLAIQIRPSSELDQEFESVNDEIEGWRSLSEQKRRRETLQATRQEIDELLVQAKLRVAKGDHAQAMELLEKAERLQPENKQVQEMLAQTQSELRQQSDALFRLGERLYREERIDSAVAIWEAALKLNPADERIRPKIDRARKVLDKLQRLEPPSG